MHVGADFSVFFFLPTDPDVSMVHDATAAPGQICILRPVSAVCLKCVWTTAASCFQCVWWCVDVTVCLQGGPLQRQELRLLSFFNVLPRDTAAVSLSSLRSPRVSAPLNGVLKAALFLVLSWKWPTSSQTTIVLQHSSLWSFIALAKRQ